MDERNKLLKEIFTDIEPHLSADSQRVVASVIHITPELVRQILDEVNENMRKLDFLENLPGVSLS